MQQSIRPQAAAREPKAGPGAGPVYNRDFDPQTGHPIAVAPGLVRVTAPNRSAFTFTGTNSFLVGDGPLFLIDPGPDDPSHHRALVTAVADRTVAAIVLTHTHKDHSALAARLSGAFSAPLWFGGPHRRSRPKKRFEIDPIARSCDWALRPDRTLADGERISAGGVTLRVVATPGHCANHLCFGVEDSPYLFSGDHVMGWNSTLVAVPDGSMADYLSSLDKLAALPFSRYLPAHGGAIADGPAFARAMKVHREMRNGQILALLSTGPQSLGTLVRQLYPGMGGRLAFAARMTVQAHLEYLAQTGRVHLSWRALGPVARLV